MKINDICILGGGTSGFSVASLLACYREKFQLDFTIKMVYSESIETFRLWTFKTFGYLQNNK